MEQTDSQSATRIEMLTKELKDAEAKFDGYTADKERMEREVGIRGGWRGRD